MKYCEQLQELRDEVMHQLKRQAPTRHDFFNLFDEDDEEGRDNLPIVAIHHKHGLYSSEYVVRVENDGTKVLAVCECTETGNWNKYELEVFDTDDLCNILDTIIDKLLTK